MTDTDSLSESSTSRPGQSLDQFDLHEIIQPTLSSSYLHKNDNHFNVADSPFCSFDMLSTFFTKFDYDLLLCLHVIMTDYCTVQARHLQSFRGTF